MRQIERYDFFELILPDTDSCPPEAVFTCNGRECHITGFCEQEDHGTVRFMPETLGIWSYTVTWRGQVWSGSFECIPNTGSNHGPVHTADKHFQYADGVSYLPFGTTCYAWIHQKPALIEQTLHTLAASPFNKICMGIFPKSMPFNHNNPPFYPFQKDEDGRWDMK